MFIINIILCIALAYSMELYYVQARYNGQCMVQVDKLSNDVKLIEARKRLGDVKCKIIKDVGCVGNYDDIAGVAAYKNRCYELGGQMFWLNEFQRCTTTQYHSQLTENKQYLNQPYCLGSNCTQEDLLQQQKRVYIPDKVKELSVRGAVCDISFENVIRTTLSGTCALEDDDIAAVLNDVPYHFNLQNTTNAVTDSNQFNSPFISACDAANGQIYKMDRIILDCLTMDENGDSTLYNATILNHLSCFGSSCSTDDMKEEVNIAYKKKWETDMRESGWFCSISIDTIELEPLSKYMVIKVFMLPLIFLFIACTWCIVLELKPTTGNFNVRDWVNKTMSDNNVYPTQSLPTEMASLTVKTQ